MKNVLITGASRGIGKKIAENLIKSGYNVFLTSRNEQFLIQTSKEIMSKGYISCDLSIKKDLEKIKKFIAINPIDILINNAGEYVYNPIDSTDYDMINKIFSVNLMTPVYLCSLVSENMKKNKWGRIINIGSISGVMGEAYASLYSSSKSGLIGLSRALALELAEYNITVNVINPGWVDTAMGIESVEKSDFTVEEIIDSIPQKRFVQPEEVADMVEYLISDSAKGVTGQSINLCAGLSVGI